MTTLQGSLSTSGASLHVSPLNKENLTTKASIDANLVSGINIDNTISANENYVVIDCDNSIGSKIEVNGSAQISNGDLGLSGAGSLVIKDGVFTEVKVNAGQTGVDAKVDLSIGTSIGVEGQTTVETKYTSSTVGAGTSIGNELAIGGGATATYDHGKVTLGVSGDLAAGLGLNVDVSGSVNVNKIAQDTTKISHGVSNETAKLSQDLAKISQDLAKISQDLAHETTKVSQATVNTATKISQATAGATTKISQNVGNTTTKISQTTAGATTKIGNKLSKSAKRKANKTKKKLGKLISP